MTAPLSLIAFAFLLAWLGPRVLRRGGWTERSPRLGVAAWQALTLSLVLTVLLAGIALAIPAIPWTTDLAALVRGCAMALREGYSTPGGAVVSATGAAAALIVLGRLGYCLFCELTRAAHDRKHQRDALAVIAQPHHEYSALIVEHPVAAAYCLPGRKRHVVLTTTALSTLDRDQLRAVLAHEQAHLRGRHHLILALADALRRAFPGVAAFHQAREALGRLVEMLADDAAAREADRLTVATALVRLGGHPATPSVALGAGGETAVSRVRRLVGPERPLGARWAAVAVTATTAMIALPLFLAIAPASAARTMPPCPQDGTSTTL